MIKLTGELEEKVKRLIEEILASSLSDSEIEDLASKWAECIREVLEENNVEYGEEDLEEVKNSFLERLKFIRNCEESDDVVEGDI